MQRDDQQNSAIRFRVSDALASAAIAKARSEQISLSELIRRGMRREIGSRP
jgi:predicted HicB family RNase H-like nuclease